MGGLNLESRPAPMPAILCALLVAGLAVAPARAADTSLAALEAGGAHADASGRLQVDVHFDCTLAPPTSRLSAAGLAVSSSVKIGSLCIVEGWVQPTALPQLDAVPGVQRISPPAYFPIPPPRALQSVSRRLSRSVQRQSSTALSIDQYGISIMQAGQFVSQTGVSGTGVTVGVQSSGVYSLSLLQSRGELPDSIKVLYPAGNTSAVMADEGTVLLEEVHAVAPGATLLYCGPSTFVDFTSCLSQLIGAGATIVLDDTGFVNDELMSQNGDESSAIAQILAKYPNVMMLSSAGNSDGTYWEGNYTPVSTAGSSLPALACPSGAGTADAYVATFGGATSQTLTIPGGGGADFPLLLAWGDPPGQITSRFDVFWFAAGSTTPLGCFTTAGSTTDQMQQQLSLPSGTYTVIVASPDVSASGKFLKLWAGGDGLTSLSVATPGGLMSPQAMVPGLLTIGAVNGSDGVGNAIEPFSSSGPLTVQFPAPAELQAPILVAPDGITVDAAGTYFAADLFPDGNFYGTSAAVPNAAAVAALLRSAFPTLSVAQITTALQTGATVLGTTQPDDVFGYGRVNAMAALATLPVPTITALAAAASSGSASSTAQAFTVTGTGTLHFTVSSSNTALVPAVIVSAGTPGVTVSSGCGSSTRNCTVSVTPSKGQAGTATVTLAVVDGANRSAAAQLTLTATNPSPGTPSTVATTSGGGHGGGGSLPLWALLCLGAVAIRSGWRALRH